MNYLTEINQLLHNNGINERHKIFVNLIKDYLHKTEYENISIELKKTIFNIFDKIDFNNKDITQKIFYTFGNKFLQKNLDQYYTPYTIGEFINNLLLPNKTILEPACGTGDFIINYNGKKILYDIDKNACILCDLNYTLNNVKNYTIENLNSLELSKYEKVDYIVTNPPFGQKTIITDKTILERYELGKNKKKQEIAILFMEFCLKLLKKDGILFIILPTGYNGNKTKIHTELREYILNNDYRILGLLYLPCNTFKRSGTGVNTSLWIIQRTTQKINEIFIKNINEIGYVLNKKNTPVKYKVDKTTGDFILDNNNNKIIVNDLINIQNEFMYYIKKNNIKNLKMSTLDSDLLYEYVLYDNIKKSYNFNIRFYLDIYNNAIKNLKYKIKDFAFICPDKYTNINKNKLYKYIEISNISTPFYNVKELYGWNLPSRATYKVKKNDILVSRLEGNISYTIISEENTDNIIVSNGLCIIRLKDINNIEKIIECISSDYFKIQHFAYTSGSIMASISINDFSNIYISEKYDKIKNKKLIEFIHFYHNLHK